MKKIYLAIPYTSMEDSAYKQATYLTSLIIQCGYNVFSPITHSHPLHKDYGVKGTWDFWSKIDYEFIDWSDEVWVIVPKEGYNKVLHSVGVNAEIKYAEEKGKPVKLITESEIKKMFDEHS